MSIKKLTRLLKKDLIAHQLETARSLGQKACADGKPRVPALDGQLNKMFAGRQIGQHPEGEAPTIKLMNAWLKGWDKANLR